jgi:hypothetical protein
LCYNFFSVVRKQSGFFITFNFDTHECDNDTQDVIWTRMSVIITLTSVIAAGTNVIPTRTSVILTRTKLISTRRVRLPHAECDFTRRMWLSLKLELFGTYACEMTLASVITTRTSVLYTVECNFHTHLDFNKHECDYDTQCVILTRMSLIMTLTSVITTRTNVIIKRTSVISAHTRLVSTRRVRFQHAECGFYTHE